MSETPIIGKEWYNDLGVTPPTQHTLTVHSSPVDGFSYTLDGTTHTTPHGDLIDDGNHTVIAIAQQTIGGTLYTFSKWEDDSTNPTRIVPLSSNITITATYVSGSSPTQHNLAVNSSPVTGIIFTIDGIQHTTNWSALKDEGKHIITMPASQTIFGEVFMFVQWDNGSTSRIRNINLTGDTSLVATYTPYVPIVSLTPTNSFGIQCFTWVFSTQDKCWYKGGKKVT